MKKLGAMALLVAGFAFTVVASADAHHSLSAFDYTTEITLEGTVTKFLFGNPHTFLHIEVKGEDGDVVVWAAEMSSIQNMIRRGVRPTTFNVGDEVILTVNPLKNGRPGGKYTSVTAPDGTTYN